MVSLGVVHKVRVCPNGVYLRLCDPTSEVREVPIIHRGKSRQAAVGLPRHSFVRFEDVTGIRPITVERIGTGERVYTRSEHGLQLETVDLRTACIGPEHDENEVLSALRIG